MNRLLLISALALGSFSVACSNNGPAAPAATGGFTNASLKGTYAFTMSGSQNDGIGTPIMRVGSFIADGNGGITGAVEDVNITTNGTGLASFVQFEGAPNSSYTIAQNGLGTVTLANASNTVPLKLAISLSTATSGLVVQIDGSSTASGSFQLQNLSNSFSPAFAFDFSGIDLNPNSMASVSIVGQLRTNTANLVSGGAFDLNDGATLASLQPILQGNLQMDSTNASFGRGSFQLNGNLFNFYMIDANHLVCIESDGVFATMGSATGQSGVPTAASQLAGSFVYEVGGAALANTGIFGAISRGGRFTFDGNSAFTNFQVDQNYNGTHMTFPAPGNSLSNVSVTIDAGGSGRGTLAFTDTHSGAIFNYVFYMSSASQGVIQDTSFDDVADGSINLQSGTFTPASLAGNYIVNWSGFNGNLGFEEDFVGQFALASATTSNISGTVDYTELGNSQVFLNSGIAGALTLSGDGTGAGASANTITMQAGGITFHFNAYILDGNEVLLFGTDSSRVVLGIATRQP
jgi:hypothetical protein